MKLKPIAQKILKELKTSISKSFWIRDTLVDKDKFDALPEQNKQEILKLKADFDNLGYIDARTQIGPDQQNRQTNTQKKRLSNTALKAFEIEDKIKKLLKSDEENKKEIDQQKLRMLQDRKSQLMRQINDLTSIFPHKLNSTRNNPYKKSYSLAKEELENIEKQINGEK